MLVQALASALETFYLSKFSWNLLSIISQNEKSKKFSKLEAKKIVKNVANISLMSITGMIIANSDRLLIGYKLDLEQLGFYTIASTLAVALNRIIGPIIIAVFPRFTSIFSKLDLNHLRKMYFLLNRLTILLITPLAIFLVIVSQELMLIWTDDAKNTKVISIVFSYLVIAQIFNSMMQVSTNLLISIDKLKILNFLNLIIIIIYIPGFYYALPYFGLVNAALSWMLLNLFSYIVIEIYTCLEIFKLGVVQFVSYLFVERLSLIVNILFLLLCIIPVKWILTLSNLQYLLLSSIYLILLYCFFTKQILRIIKNLSD